ncbi:MAG: hypothetical protein WCF84_14750 [Anaerolineae bacterium]
MKIHSLYLFLVLFVVGCTATPVPIAPTRVQEATATLVSAVPTTVGELPATATQIAPSPESPTATAIVASPTATPTRPPATVSPTRSGPAPTRVTLTPLPEQTSADGRQWYVRTLLVGPGQPSRLYALIAALADDVNPAAALSVVQSDDAGASWTPTLSAFPVEPACVRRLNMDYASAGALYLSTCRGLYRWTDGAWKQLSSVDLNMVAIVYGHPQTLWAATNGDPASPVSMSNDGGVTWHSAANGLVHFSGVADVGIDPRNSDTLYAIIVPKYAGTYLRRGTASGNWTSMPAPLNDSQIDTGMTIDGQTGALYVSVFNKDHWELWRTLNPAVSDVNSVTWEMVHNFAGYSWLTVLASGTGPQGLTLYVRVMQTHGMPIVLRSLDQGQTWTPLRVQ